MAGNKYYKKSFTEAEVKACFAWFERNMDRLPQSLELNVGVRIPDVSFTVQNLMHKLQHQMKGNPTYSGEFSNLLYIQHCIKEQASFKKKKTNL